MRDNIPWRTPRLYDLEDCLPNVISARKAARRSAESADDCVVHSDGENAILSETETAVSSMPPTQSAIGVRAI
jgi:hypothetical protein